MCTEPETCILKSHGDDLVTCRLSLRGMMIMNGKTDIKSKEKCSEFCAIKRECRHITCVPRSTVDIKAVIDDSPRICTIYISAVNYNYYYNCALHLASPEALHTYSRQLINQSTIIGSIIVIIASQDTSVLQTRPRPIAEDRCCGDSSRHHINPIRLWAQLRHIQPSSRRLIAFRRRGRFLHHRPPTVHPYSPSCTYHRQSPWLQTPHPPRIRMPRRSLFQPRLRRPTNFLRID
jgi:hypothetical protein